MANRTWLAVILCSLVWFVYMQWFAPPLTPPPTPTPTQTPAQTSAGKQPSSPSVGTGSGIPVDGSRHFSPFETRPVLSVSEKLSSAQKEVSFSSLGGKVAAIQLPDFTESLKHGAPRIRSLDPEKMPHSMGSFFTHASLASFGMAEFGVRKQNGTVYLDAAKDGVRVLKQLTPADGTFFLSKHLEIRFDEPRAQDWGYLLVPLGGTDLVANSEDPLRAWEAVAFQNGSITRKGIDDIRTGSEVLQGETGWIAFGNRYFSNVVVNESPINPDVVFERSAEFVGVYLRFPLIVKADQNQLNFQFRLFSGPKEYSELSEVPGLKQLIDYGMFSFLAFPLLELLRFFNRFVHNFGWAIILLTVLVRILFYPLSLKSYRSMKAMQKLQPQIAALKEKYKDDNQKFAQEQMALFRSHKVNPAGGCLPVLVQLPVFIALYSVLQNSVELFHAPFMGWIQDLSSKDPFFIFPVLMGISMFLQQKMTPTPGMDPMQQKILLAMPVVFTFIMLNLPSGLTIYIFVSTLLGILQQLAMNRESSPTVPSTAAAGK